MTFTEQPMVAACDQTGIAFMIIQSELCSAAVWGRKVRASVETRFESKPFQSNRRISLEFKASHET
ncbi:MAG TPA: hypothetical protein DDZ90_01185 [Planctomycetaceae bacterium]|nr:hypothetical protein [Planctomycetaceae bacterium]